MKEFHLTNGVDEIMTESGAGEVKEEIPNTLFAQSSQKWQPERVQPDDTQFGSEQCPPSWTCRACAMGRLYIFSATRRTSIIVFGFGIRIFAFAVSFFISVFVYLFIVKDFFPSILAVHCVFSRFFISVFLFCADCFSFIFVFSFLCFFFLSFPFF